MTLIEVLLEYQRIFRTHGGSRAYQWLKGACDHSLWEHVITTFDNNGNFIDADGMIVYNIDAGVI